MLEVTDYLKLDLVWGRLARRC